MKTEFKLKKRKKRYQLKEKLSNVLQFLFFSFFNLVRELF